MSNLLTKIRGAGGGGGKGGGGGGAGPQFEEAPNTLRSKSIARVLDLIGEGEIYGLVNGAQSIKLDGTPLQSSDGTFNFTGFTWQQRTGTPSQDYISGFTAAEEEVNVSLEVKHGMPIVQTVTDPDINAMRVKVRIPQLTETDTKTGSIYGTGVHYQIDIQPYGGSYSNVVDEVVGGKTVSPYERQYRINLPTDPGQFPVNVRLTRLTEDSTSSAKSNKTFWASYTKLTDAKLRYVDSALVGIVIDAQYFGDTIPVRSYHVKGKIIQVPSNYNSTTRTYTGIWDGTFTLAYSNNPAWVLYDLITNSRYGLGRQIAASQVDKWSLYNIGKYCDESVPDGLGGTEPRFTFNGIINTRQEAYSVINAISSAFRGMVYWGTGAITATQDSPGDAGKLVTPANVVDGVFNYAGTSLKARHTVALVTWNDPGDSYKAAIEVVEDPDGIAEYGYRQADVVAFGCTSRGQARRLGKWLLDSEKYETETVTYKASFDQADLRPGELIKVMDPSYAGARNGGRVKDPIDTTHLELDELGALSLSETNTLLVVMPDASVESKTISAVVGNTVTLSSALSTLPMVGAMWIISSASLQPRTFRVLSVAEKADNLFEVTALLHDSTKYTRIEEDVQFDTGSFTVLKTGKLPTITELNVLEYQYLAGVVAKAALSISWTPPDDPRAYLYQVDVQAPGEPDFSTLGFVNGLSYELKDIQPGRYGIRVKAYTAMGDPSEFYAKYFTIQGLLAVPANVEEFLVNTNGEQLLATWKAVADLDLDYYKFRYNAATDGSAIWENSQDFGEKVSRQHTSVMMPKRNGTYFIKAVDTSGVESESAISFTITTAELEAKNIVITDTQHPTWSGAKTNTVKIGNYVQLASADVMEDWITLEDLANLYYGMSGVVSEGYVYSSANPIDLGAKYPVRVSAKFIADAIDLLNVMSGWDTLSSLAALDLTKLSEWEVELQIAYSNDSITWSAWERLQIGTYEGRYFKLRAWLKSYSASITPRLKEQEVVFDMPDRVVSGQDITSGAAPYAVTYSPAFKAKPSLGINPQNMATGDYYVVSSASRTGFTVTFYNSAGTVISRVFDYFAKGYGIQTS